MQPIQFEEQQFILGAGDNPNTNNLPVAVATEPVTRDAGVGMLVSCWEPTLEEIAEITKTRKVWLAVMCHPNAPTQPPVYVGGLNPYKAHGYTNHDRHQKKFENQVDAILIEASIRSVVKAGLDPYNDERLKSHNITKEQIDQVLEKMADEATTSGPLEDSSGPIAGFDATEAI